MPSQNRLEAAYRRLGIKVSTGITATNLPTLSIGQVRRLQAIFPMRLLEPGEDVDAYRHYCGAAQLVQELALLCKADGEEPADAEEVLTAEAVGRAIAQANGTEYIEEE